MFYFRIRIAQYNVDVHSLPHEHTYVNLIPMSTFEGLSQQILKFTKSP
jgi:hypothetical protein